MFVLSRFCLAALLLLTVVPARAGEGSKELQDLQATSRDFYKSGDFNAALDFGERALALMERELGPESEQMGIQTWGLGLTSEQAGRLDLAEKYYARSVKIREKVYGPESAGTMQAVENLGRVLLKTGRGTEAEALFRRVLASRQEMVGRDHAFTAGGHSNLADVNLARRNWPAALGEYREAIRLLVGQDTSTAVVKSIVEDDIRRHHETFLGLARAAWAMTSQSGTNAAAILDETFAASQQAWQTSAASALAKMSARLGAGETDLGKRIRQTQDLSARVVALQAADMQSLADWSKVQQTDPAYSKLLAEFRAVSIANARDGAPAYKRQKELVEKLQAELKRCPPEENKPGCAQSEQQRKAITDELQTLSQASAADAGPIMELHGRMEAAEKRLPGFDAFTAKRTALRNDIDTSERTMREARAAIIKSYPEYVGLAEPKPLTVPETRALLGPDEALVAYLVGNEKSFVWALSKERAEWAEIDAGSAALSELVRTLRQGLDPLALPDDPASIETGAGFDLGKAHALYKLVLGPVAKTITGKKHLLIVPAGPLTSVPFQVLVTSPPPAVSDAEALRDAAWLIKSTALSVLPSVPSLNALRRFAKAGAGAKPFFGVGDPLLQGPGGDKDKRSARGSRPAPATFYRNGLADVRAVRELMPLPDTAQEINAIAALLGAGRDSVLLREAASETRVRNAPLNQYRIVQFATHGLVAGELSALAEPALVLTPPATPSEDDDGLLTASEIATLKLNADWVVLSACNTAAGSGAGEQQGAEALSGLARAFFFAGARTLLVSHWAVYSSAATKLTTGTFATLAGTPGIGRAEAFRRSMLALIAEGKPPSYWAPFVVVGEGGALAR